MRKAIAFISAIILLLLVAYHFAFQEYGHMQYDTYLLNDIETIRCMMNGTTKEGDISELSRINKGVSMYKRGDSLYFGERKIKVQNVTPYFISNGAALLLYEPSAKLISKEFELYDTYSDMYIANGHSFNSDGQMADQEEFLLLGLMSGAFMNVQDMLVESPGGNFTINSNSILCVKEDVMRFYNLEDSTMEYDCFTDVIDAYVTIGTVRMNYSDFFESLYEAANEYLPASLIELIDEEKKVSENTDSEIFLPPIEGEDNKSEGEESTSGKENLEITSVISETGLPSDKKAAASEERVQLSGIQSVQNIGSIRGGYGTTESSVITSSDTPAVDESLPSVYVKPMIHGENIRATVYTISVDVTIEDPENKLTKGAKVIIYKDGKLYMRKTISNTGTITLGAIAPNSTYEVEGEFEYRSAANTKVTEVFMEKTSVHTLELSSLPDIRLSYEHSTELYPHSVKFQNLQIAMESSIETPTDIITDYISKIVIRATKSAKTLTLELSSEDIGRLKLGQAIAFTSADVLESNSDYEYEIVMYDRFSNILQVNRVCSQSNHFRTCKQPPIATLTIDSNAVGRFKLGVHITDSDHTDVQNMRLYLYDSEGNAFSLQLSEESETREYLPINQTIGVKKSYTIINLPSNQQFEAVLYSDYKSGISDTEFDQTDYIIGRTTFYTSPLSVLGCVYFNTTIHNIMSDSVTIRASIKPTTNEVLLQLLDSINFRLKSDRGEHSYLLKKSELEVIGVNEGDAFEETIYESNEICIKLTGTALSGQTNLWQSLTGGTAVIEYFMKGGLGSVLHSATSYLGYLDCRVNQGGIYQDIANPYTNASFKTLRMKPQVEYKGSIAANDFFEVYDLQIKDPDQCIQDGIIYARLKSTVTQKVVDMQIISSNTIINKLTFSALEAETEYQLEFICKQYNEGFMVTTASERFVLPFSFTFTTGFNLSGNIALNSLEYGDANQGVLFGKNIFTSTNSTPNVRFDTINDTTGNTSTFTTHSITDFIEVKGGSYYRMNNFCLQTTTDSNRLRCRFYTKDEDTGDYVLLKSGTYFGMQEAIIHVPNLATHIRVEYPNAYVESASIREILVNLKNGANLVTSFVDGKYVNTSGVEVTNSSYKSTDYIPVEEGAYYYRTTDKASYGGAAARYVMFYNKDKKFIMWYAVDQNDTLIQSPARAAYMRTYLSNSEATNFGIYRINNGKKQTNETNEMLAEIHVNIDDKNHVLEYSDNGSNLCGHFYLNIFKNGTSIRKNTFDFDAGPSNSLNEVIVNQNTCLALEHSSSYQIELSVMLISGQEVVLDTIEFTTESNLKLLRNEYDILNMKKDIYAKYRMVNDINYSATTDVTSYFYGTLDGGGNTLTFDLPSAFCSYLQKGAEIKNLHLERTLTADYAKTRYFVTYNSGTIKDIVNEIHTNCENNKRSNRVFMAYVNQPTGVIERFSIQLDGDIYMGYSLVSLYNYGNIRNGYANGGDYYITSGVYGGSSESRLVSGVITSYNFGGGNIENVYVSGDMYIEAGSGTSNCGLVVGYNRNGNISNSFSVGDRYVYTVDSDNLFTPVVDTVAGPPVGSSAGAYKNLYYVSENAYKSTAYIRAAAYTLWDEKWYEGNVNCQNCYRIEGNINMGYFPKIIFKENDMYQPSYELPPYEPVQSPQLISAVVTNQYEDYALCTLTFRNPQKYHVNSFAINGLTCEVLAGDDSQYFEGDLYRVLAKVSAPTLYRSNYPIVSTSFGYMGGSYTSTYGIAEGQEMPVSLNAEFWMQIHDASEWIDITLDLKGNYRIVEDLDFNFINSADIAIRSCFEGVLDGGIYDEEGKLTGIHSISNLDVANYGYVFYKTTNSTIKNLQVNELMASSVPALSGFIAYLSPGSVIDNVHIKNATVYARSYAGGIAAKMDSASIVNCSVNGLHIIALNAQTLYIGGIAGYVNNYSTIENCFAANINFEVLEASGNGGTGGICGFFSGTRITDCYAWGKIDTNFGYVGGLVGSTTQQVKRCWSDVDIMTMAGNVGGAIGCYLATGMNATNILYTGDIFTNSDIDEGIGRIYGYTLSPLVNNKVFGYTKQLVAGDVSENNIYGVQENFTPEMLRDRDNYNGKNNRLSLQEGVELLESVSDNDLEEEDEDRAGYYNMKDIDNGYLPRLYSTKGDLLPNQNLHLVPDASAYIRWNTGWSMADYNEAYRAYFTVYHMNYTVKNIDIEGMNLPDNIHPVTSVNGTSTYDIRDIIPIECRDTFRLVVTLEDSQHNELILTMRVSFLNSTLYHEIHSAEDWQTLMAAHGDSYENFMLYGNIDLSTINEADLVKNVRVGKMCGCDSAAITVSGQHMGAGDNLIADCSSEMSDIAFRNCQWKTTSSAGTSFGLIGNLGGVATNLTFDNIDIDSYASETCGCIANLSGVMTNTTMSDVRHLYRSGAYKGGLIGKITSLGSLDGVTITASKSETIVNDTVTGESIAMANAWIKPSITSYSNSYIGYIVGSSSGLIKGVSVTTEDNAYIEVKGYAYVGGIAGIQNICSDYLNGAVRECNLNHMYVTGGYCYIGGAVGITYYKLVDVHLDDSIVYSGLRTNGLYVGGLCGLYSGAENSSVRNCIIGNLIKDSYVGGAFGSSYSVISRSLQVENTIIQGTYRIGGIAGQMYSIGTNYAYYGCTVDNCSIVAKGDCAGGITGYGSNVKEDCIVKNSTIQANNYAGGIVGRTNYNISDAYAIREVGVDHCTVIAQNLYAGGIAGEYGLVSLYNAYVKDSYIEAKFYAGGVAGTAEGGTYRNMAVYAQDIDRNDKVFAKVSYAGGLFGNLCISNRTLGNTLLLNQIYVETDVEAPDYIGGIAGTTRDSREELKSLQNDYLKGILLAVRVKALGPNLLITEASGLTGNHGGLLVGDAGLTNVQNSGLNSQAVQYYAESYAKLYSGEKTVCEVNDSDGKPFARTSEELATQNTYTNSLAEGGLGFEEKNYEFANFVPDGSGIVAPYGFMPKIRRTTNPTGEIYPLLSNQENWIPVPTFTDIVMFAAPFSMLFRTSAVETLPELSVYASGADTINLEFDSTIPYEDTENLGIEMMILCDGEEISTVDVKRRVYTLQYNYRDELTVLLKNGQIEEEYTIMPTDFSNTLWMENEEYYYLNDYGVYGSKGQLIGDFVSIRDGHALTYNGTLYELEEGSIVRESTPIELLSDVKPSLRTQNGTTILNAYGHFSVCENNDEIEITEGLLLYFKNDRLVVFDPKLLSYPTAFIYEEKGNIVYSACLTDNGEFVDLADQTICLPEDFRNFGLKECSHNVYSSLPYIFVRYESGRVVAFNYQTGEKIDISEITSDENLITYTSTYLQQLLAPSTKVTGFSQIKKVEDELQINGAVEEFYEGTDDTSSTTDDGTDEIEAGEIGERTISDFAGANGIISGNSEAYKGTQGESEQIIQTGINPLAIYYSAKDQCYKLIQVETLLNSTVKEENTNEEKTTAFSYVTSEGVAVDKNGFNSNGEYIGEAVATAAYQDTMEEKREEAKVGLFHEKVEETGEKDMKGIVCIILVFVAIGLIGTGIVFYVKHKQ